MINSPHIGLLATCVRVGGQTICDAFPTPNLTSGATPGPENAFGTFGDVMSRIFVFVFPISGVILFFIIVSAGFDYMRSAGETSKIDAAWKKITYSLYGFMILVLAFFIVRTVAVILGLDSPI